MDEQRLKDEAELLRWSLEAGFRTVGDAVAWADSVIEAHPQPPISIIEIALAGRRSLADMATLLAAVPGEPAATPARRNWFAEVLRVLDAQPEMGEAVARVLARLTAAEVLPSDEFGWDAYGLVDAFELARQGVAGTYEDAMDDLRDYLTRHVR
jgi:hypothetical protein